MDTHLKIRLRNEVISAFPKITNWREHFNLWHQSFVWEATGWPEILPSFYKRVVLKAEALRLPAEIFVETGTFLGDTLWFMRGVFPKLYSIEVEQKLAAAARHRFRRLPHIHIIEGDSATKLREIMPRINRSCLFWLDGHYSSGITGRGVSDCPIWQELKAIAELAQTPFSIFIDDARLFGHVDFPDYPAIKEVRLFAERNFPRHDFKVENEIIMIRQIR